MLKTKFIVVFFLAVFSVIAPIGVYAETPTPTSVVDAHQISCFDYYTFGSVQIPVSPSVTTAAAGTKITFSGEVRNTNPYPVVQGRIVARIFKTSADGLKNVNGPDVVDEFIVKDNLTLQASSSMPISLDWSVPQYTEPGSYKIALFFVSAGKFNLLGLTFTDDIIGNSASFSVANEFYKGDSIRFVKENVYIGDLKHRFAAFPHRLPATTSVPISAQIENTTKQDQKVDVTWKLYSWDAQHESNFIGTKIDTVTVKAGRVATTTYTVTDTSHAVYYAVAEISHKGVKSIIAPRFVRDGIEKTRINFPAVTSYPLQKNTPVELFSCMHATSDAEDAASTTQGLDKMILSLKDKKGKVIHVYTYTGTVTGQMMGVKDSFTPKKEYTDFTLSAELYRGDALMDRVDMKYSCEELGSECEDKASMVPWLLGVLGILLILWAIVWGRKKKEVKKVLTMVIVGVGLSVSALVTYADWTVKLPNGTIVPLGVVNSPEVLLENTIMGEFYQREWSDGTEIKAAFTNPHVTVAYKTEIRKSTGELVQNGDMLPVGAQINVKFVPHIPDHLRWFTTGSAWDSPYGSWGNNSTPPPTTCSYSDYTFNGGSIYTMMVEFFVELVVTPPVKTLTNVEGMTCGAISNGEAQCVITGNAQVGLDMNFAGTQGSFYIHKRDGGRPCSTSIPNAALPLKNQAAPYTLEVPTQTIRYSFAAAPVDNLPPTNPVISGPTMQDVAVENTFGFVSTDPDNDTLRYGIDWTNDGVDSVNTWVPVEFTADEVEQFTTKAWPEAGTFTFKALAQDNKGANSGWTTHTITIAPDQCTNVAGWQPPAPLFNAHDRDYYFSEADGKLYFAPASAPGSSACSVDMCANTSAVESNMPTDYKWDTNQSDPYTKYSCVPVSYGASCGCVGRAQTCVDDTGAIITQTQNAAECSLSAFCTYPTPVIGNSVTFTFGATNVLGTLLGGGSVVKNIVARDGTPIVETRTVSDSADNEVSTATCSYTPLAGGASPSILSFTTTPIVEKGQACVFTWETQDMASCTLSGTNVPVTGAQSFSTSAGNNINKTLSCISDEDTPQTLSQTKTCLVRPTVTEQ